MNTNVFARVCKISLAACLALVLGTSFADAGQYGSYGHGYSNYGQSYSRNYQPSYQGYGQGYGYGQRSFSPPQYGGFGGYSGSSSSCRPHYQSQPQYGFSGGYQGGSYGRYR